MRHELQSKEYGGIDGRSPPLGIAVLHPVPDEGEVELGIEAAVGVVSRNEGFKADGGCAPEGVRRGGAEQDGQDFS
jgi:hypothetical protein